MLSATFGATGDASVAGRAVSPGGGRFAAATPGAGGGSDSGASWGVSDAICSRVSGPRRYAIAQRVVNTAG